jgi:hypothetical protein
MGKWRLSARVLKLDEDEYVGICFWVENLLDLENEVPIAHVQCHSKTL